MVNYSSNCCVSLRSIVQALFLHWHIHAKTIVSNGKKRPSSLAKTAESAKYHCHPCFQFQWRRPKLLQQLRKLLMKGVLLSRQSRQIKQLHV